jgi:hypothetical protein
MVSDKPTADDDLSSARGRFFNPRRNPIGFARKNQRSDFCLRQQRIPTLRVATRAAKLSRKVRLISAWT